MPRPVRVLTHLALKPHPRTGAYLVQRDDGPHPTRRVAVMRSPHPSGTGRALHNQIRDWFHGDLDSFDTYVFRQHRWGFDIISTDPVYTCCLCHGGPMNYANLSGEPDAEAHRRFTDWTYRATAAGLSITWAHAYADEDSRLIPWGPALPWSRWSDIDHWFNARRRSGAGIGRSL